MEELKHARIVAGIPIIRMPTLLGGSQGGSALTYTSVLLSICILPFGKIFKWISVAVLLTATICLASFTTVFVMIAGVFMLFIFKFYPKLKQIVLPLLFILPVLILPFTKAITFTVGGNRELSLYDYATDHASKRIESVFSNSNILTGIGFDIKTSANPDDDRKVPRDNGILSAYVSHGITGFTLVLLFYFYGFYRIYKILNMPLSKEDRKVYLTASIIFLSTIFFTHGLSIISKPIDVLVFVSAGILFNSGTNPISKYKS
jgi:O-antigen ligase